ncbi:MAG: MOSC domain-containing protein [Alphaproteobacteria bacterium]|nr:MOSC domain-containing protein [Alphaproteobacteria bacterium]
MSAPEGGRVNRGDSRKHLDRETVEALLADLPPAPTDRGTVRTLVARGPEEARSTPASVALTVEGAFPGDRWSAAKDPERRQQITVMEEPVGLRIANGQPMTLFGDNLVVDLDLGSANLPVGSVLRVGGATVEVTDKAHTGCKKYGERFGTDALAAISTPERKPRRLRGIHVRVVTPGDVAVGDAIEVLRRGPA